MQCPKNIYEINIYVNVIYNILECFFNLLFHQRIWVALINQHVIPGFLSSLIYLPPGPAKTSSFNCSFNKRNQGFGVNIIDWLGEGREWLATTFKPRYCRVFFKSQVKSSKSPPIQLRSLDFVNLVMQDFDHNLEKLWVCRFACVS